MTAFSANLQAHALASEAMYVCVRILLALAFGDPVIRRDPLAMVHYGAQRIMCQKQGQAAFMCSRCSCAHCVAFMKSHADLLVWIVPCLASICYVAGVCIL